MQLNDISYTHIMCIYMADASCMIHMQHWFTGTGEMARTE